MEITVSNLEKSYGGKPVLRNLSMSLKKGELVSIVGPSGVGKTTLLRILAGLEQADGGKIDYAPNAESWKPTIMVFQDFMLFPHINIRKNIAYGIESPRFYERLFPEHAKGGKPFSPAFRRTKRAQIEALGNEYVESFGLLGLEDKYPAQLSAGQKQRVSLARAMVIRPSLLLLDEPFANLDQNLKMETALFIRDMQQRFGVSILAVTHDQQEAFAMSDRVGVMLHGEILQMSDVETLYRFPVNAEVGAFLGAINVLPSRLYPLCEFCGQAPASVSPGASILVRAESVELLPDEGGPGLVKQKRFQGTLIHLEIELGGSSLVAYSLSPDLAPGQRVRVCIRDFVDGSSSGPAPAA